jgi:outer membrane receptor for Fe3+-dicitrate
MRNFKNVLAVALFLMGATLFAQTKLTGKVVDEFNQALPGADVIIKGTTQGTSTDFDGNFSLETSDAAGTVSIGFMGYISKALPFNGSQDFGTVQLAPSAESLSEVVIVGVADIAKDRETPVAVSTIKATEIIEKLGAQEFPEILKTTPSVYATKSGGGYGDARINIRGFSQRNIAVMINGMPVNDMENSKVYWSNWSGLSDVTTAMQVQRGLGSSKLAISSVGGTINVLTKTSDARKGGNFSATYGNDNFLKVMGSYSTGKLDSGLSASVLLSQFQGDGYVDATSFKGNTYFIGLGYEVNDKHSVMFTATGAPQWHNQRYYTIKLSDYISQGKNGEPNIKYNNLWGYLDGEEFNFRKNYYHKPVSSLNWEWKMNDASSLATVVYASWGRGGGTGDAGRINGGKYYYSQFRDDDGLIRFDDIKAWNSGQSVPDFGPDRVADSDGNYINDPSNGFTRRSSVNSHNWYGIVSNFHHDVNEKFGYDFGIDLRTYKGQHYRVVNDVLGADAFHDYSWQLNNPDPLITEYVEAQPDWNPFIDITDQQKWNYHNDGKVNWLGAFGQIEYKNDMVSSFLQFGASRKGYQRIDYFNYLDSDPEQTSPWVNKFGGNVKAGVNLNLSENHNVFVNAGFYSKQPEFGANFLNYKNDINEGLTNEQVSAFELGYGYRAERASFNLNLYRTSWEDRYLRIRTYIGPERYDVNMQGVSEIHTGIEADLRYKALENLTFKAMMSLGNWEYKGDATGDIYDDNQNFVDNVALQLDGVKVGDAAQFTSRLGLDWKVFKNFTFDIDQFFVDKLYAKLDAKSADESLRLPAYSLTNMGMAYKFNLGEKMGLKLRLNVNNVADEVYISESSSNVIAGAGDETWNGVNTSNQVWFGHGRTWTVTALFNF